jgi:pyruvate/2-oxoglutarate dehydrogenase complex dihydrolipoamide acyltransferase (E2) component
MPTKVIMPQLGESVVEGTVTKWLRQEGEQIEEFESLLEVNTDKVDTEIPAPAAGTLLKILVPDGETVEAGTLLAWIGEPGEELPADGEREDRTQSVALDEPSGAAPGHSDDTQPVGTGIEPPEQPSPPPAVEPAAQEPPAKEPVSEVSERREMGFISPVVARMADEHDVDLQQVEGTGEGGRITKRDVQAFLEQREHAPAPEPEAEPGAPAPWETPGEGDLFRPTELMFPGEQDEEEQPAPAKERAEAEKTGIERGQVISLSPIRQRIAQHMVQSKNTAPHVTTVMEANLSRVSAHRAANKARYAQNNINLTYTAYFIAAMVEALKAYPLVNSSWTDEGIRVHSDIHIGMAVSLGEDGLIVPVIKNADGYSLLGLARTINDLAHRARNRQLKPDEVRGGTFSITNHGTGGSLFATPIINQPQAGILGVGAMQKRVVVIDDAIAIRPMVYLTLTFDHRILDGAAGDGFLARVVSVLEEWA